LCDGLFSLSKHYRNDSDQREDLEVVVVDDGSPTKPARPVVMNANLGFMVKLVELPIKQGPLNPCVPINRGVERANGEFICLSNPEIQHRGPLLWEMRDTIQKLGPKTYVHAAVWGLQSASWHTHSCLNNAYHFLCMLHRDLWNEAGGFDERYREGYCFDDPDWLQRTLKVGAKIVWLDHLIADHSQDGDAKHWRSREEWNRNEALFHDTWPNPIAVDGRALSYAQLQNWRQE
jgi:hypothetical protein